MPVQSGYVGSIPVVRFYKCLCVKFLRYPPFFLSSFDTPYFAPSNPARKWDWTLFGRLCATETCGSGMTTPNWTGDWFQGGRNSPHGDGFGHRHSEENQAVGDGEVNHSPPHLHRGLSPLTAQITIRTAVSPIT